nr:hypothetical protein GCM10020092_070140 [Actinoplanes digitatis]
MIRSPWPSGDGVGAGSAQRHPVVGPDARGQRTVAAHTADEEHPRALPWRQPRAVVQRHDDHDVVCQGVPDAVEVLAEAVERGLGDVDDVHTRVHQPAHAQLGVVG